MAESKQREPVWISWLLLVSLGVFIVGMGIAMVQYPGGTWFDRTAESHQFWHNFLCDMLRADAINGKPNPATTAAIIGLLGMLPAVGAQGFVLRGMLRETGRPVLGQVIAVFSSVSLIGILGVPLTPSDAYPVLHSLCVIGGAGLGLAAAVSGIVGQCFGRATLGNLYILGILMMVFALTNLFMYVNHSFFDSPLTPTIPIAQKLATIFAVLWLGGSAVQRIRPATAPHAP